MTTSKSFLGTGWSFPPEFDKGSRDVRLVSEEQDIRESLMILLATHPGERMMQPSYGCGLKAHVHDQITPGTVTLIRDTIERAVLFFEPRVKLNRIETDDSRQYEGILNLTLHYTVRSTNTRYNIVYPFYFLEGTDIDPLYFMAE